MQKKKFNERTLLNKLLENQNVAIDIIIHGSSFKFYQKTEN